MRIIVYGAGAVGGIIAGRLFEHRESHGHEVLAIARGEHLEAIRLRGLTIIDAEREVTLPLAVVGHPCEIAWSAGDIVILAMKSQHTEAALADLVAAGAPVDLPIVCAQNGVANERAALRCFSRVYGLNVVLPGGHLDPGVVVSSMQPVSGILDVGRYPSGIDEVATTVCASLRSSNFYSTADPDVMAKKYSKLLMNLGNALDAAVGPGARSSDLYKRARAEGVAALDAAGIRRQADEADAEQRSRIRMAPVPGQKTRGSSTMQSLMKESGSVEVDYLNGEICLLGRLHGVPTPVNAMLQRVVNRMAREHNPPGSLTFAELEAELA